MRRDVRYLFAQKPERRGKCSTQIPRTWVPFRPHHNHLAIKEETRLSALDKSIQLARRQGMGTIQRPYGKKSGTGQGSVTRAQSSSTSNGNQHPGQLSPSCTALTWPPCICMPPDPQSSMASNLTRLPSRVFHDGLSNHPLFLLCPPPLVGPEPSIPEAL